MRVNASFQPSLFRLAIGGILLGLWLLSRLAIAADAPPLPPGVTIEPLATPAALPEAYRAQMLSVDWTHPLLRVQVQHGLPPGQTTPLAWSRLEQAAPLALFIQLSEPRQVKQHWFLALPLAVGPGKDSPTRLAPHLTLGELCPWLPGGPPLDAEPEFISPLDSGAPVIATRWLGRVEDLDSQATLSLQTRCLLSWTNPASGRSRFALVVREQGGQGELGDLMPWIEAESRPGEWLAIHSLGEYAAAGVGSWRLTNSGNPRRTERVGVALKLSAITPGDPVDWARLVGCTLGDSSHEADGLPENLISGRLWPTPLRPSAWVSRLEGQGAGQGKSATTPWVELRFNAARPVSRIVLAWPSAIGWSEHFNPGRVILQMDAGAGSDLRLLKDIRDPADLTGPTFTWESPQPLTVRRLRLEFTEPTRLPSDARARLAAIQVWGPWDGKTQRP